MYDSYCYILHLLSLFVVERRAPFLNHIKRFLSRLLTHLKTSSGR